MDNQQSTPPSIQQAEAQPTPSLSKPQQKQPKKKLWIIGGVAAVLVIGAAVAAGLYVYVRTMPDYLLRTATHNLVSQPAHAAKFRFVSGTEDNGAVFSGDIAVQTDQANPQNGEFVLGVGTGDSRVGVSLRAVDNTYYLRMADLQNLPTLLQAFSPEIAELYNAPQVVEALQSVNDQWYHFDPQQATQLLGTGQQTAPTAADLQKVWDIYRRHTFLAPHQIFADETIEGVPTAHFSIRLDRERYVAFLQELQSVNIQGLQVTNEQIEQAKNESATIQDGSFEVWIARANQQFKQVRMTDTTQGQAMNITLTFVTDLPNFESLQKPQDAKPFDELVSTLNDLTYSMFLQENATGF